MSEPQTSLEFYGSFYSARISGHLAGSKRTIGVANPRHCRFCGRSAPEAHFRSEAHAMPHAIGNNSLISLHECDDCNRFFGRTLEDSYAKWTAIQRLASQIVGKNGIPTYKSKDGSIRWEARKGESHISILVETGAVILDEAAHKLTIKTDVQPHVPRLAYKCLVKMALSVMPADDLAAFSETVNWLRQTTPAEDRYNGSFCKVLLGTISGPRPFAFPTYILMKRKDDRSKVPHFSFILAWGNFTQQIFLPFSTRDQHLHGQQLTLPAFPNPCINNPAWKINFEPIDLSSTEVTKNDTQTIDFFLSERIRPN